MLWQNESTGDLAEWRKNRQNSIAGLALTPTRISDTGGDRGLRGYEPDGRPDIIWQYDWVTSSWLMNGESRESGTLLTERPLWISHGESSLLAMSTVGSADPLATSRWPRRRLVYGRARVSVRSGPLGLG